jgi:WD40 repeat protein
MRLPYQGRQAPLAAAAAVAAAAALLACSVGPASAQGLEYLSAPEQLWQQSAGTTQEGNGLFWSPDGSAVVGTFADGSVRAFSPSTGEQVLSYAPDPLSGSTLAGLGGVTFAGYGGASDSPYMVYAVADNANDPTTAQTYVSPFVGTGSFCCLQLGALASFAVF